MKGKIQFTQKRKKVKSEVIPLAIRIRGIRKKLILAYSLPILLFIIFGILSYMQTSQIIVENYKQANMNMLKKTGEFYEILFQTVDGKSQQFASDSEVRNYYSGLYKDNSKLEQETFTKINGQAIKESIADENINVITILAPYGQLVTSSGQVGKEAYEGYIKTEDGKLVSGKKGKAVWRGNHYFWGEYLKLPKKQYGITISREIMNNQMNSVGVLAMDIQTDALIKPLKSVELPQGSKCAFITSDGREFTADGENATNYFFGEECYKSSLESKESEGIQQLNYQDQEYFYMYYKVGETGCMLGTLIPKSEIVKQADSIKNMTIIIVIIASFIAIIVSAILANGIGSEIQKVNNTVKKASEGDLTVVCNTKRKDEFSLLSKNITEMLKSMKKVIQQSADVSSMVTNSSEALSKTSVQLVESSKTITGIIQEMDAGIGQQAEEAKICLNKMENLGEKIANVNEGTIKMSKFAIDTKDIVSSGIVTIDELGHKAKETSKITKSVIDNIENLEKESHFIESIIDTINSIAKQTNLLALNASIEAARAGDAGKGFSVVAEEIRKLAEGSLEASSKISKIVGGIKSLTQNTAETARNAEQIVLSQDTALQKTIKAFDDITQHVEELTNDIEKISLRIKDIEKTKNETEAAIGSISQVLQETAAASAKVQTSAESQLSEAEFLNSSAEELRNYSVQLKETIHTFKID